MSAPAEATDTATGTVPASGRIPGLDGLRALAVIAVVWHHTRPSGIAGELATRGYLGVDVFFVISGFLITRLLLREERSAGSVHLGRFFARRALRLFPLWYLLLGALTIYYLGQGAEDPARRLFFEDLPWNATYTSDFIYGGTFLALSWSLAMEEQFYLLWPPILTLLRGAALPLLVVLGGLSIGVHAGAFDELLAGWVGEHWRYYAALTATALPLVLGCALGLALDGTPDPSRPRWASPFGHALAFPVSFTLLVAAAASPLDEGPMRLLAQGAAAAVVAATVLGPPHRLLEIRGLRWLGERSYGVYLLHMLCVQGLFALGLAPGGTREAWFFPLTVAVSAAAAGVSYAAIERPCLRLKERLRGAPGTN